MKSIDLLKIEVRKTFGRRILSSADCQNLCSDILRTSSAKISFNTVRRVFNLIKTDHEFSTDTLDVLSNYCGFFSFDNFIISKTQCVITEQEKTLLAFLTLFFKQIEVAKRHDFTYLKLVQQTVLHLENYPAIIDRFQREIAKTKNGQTFYYEQFVFIDRLNSYYGKGLQYYLIEKKTKEAQLFGHSLLCYYSWLIKNAEGVEKHYKKIMRYKIDKTVSNSVTARYFSTQLFYINSNGLNEKLVLAKIRSFYLSMNDCNDNYSYLNCFEIILSEALILIAQFDEALFYISEVLKKVKGNISSYIDVAFHQNICMLKAIVFANTGRKIKAYDILQDIDPYKFSSLSRQYLNILYLSTMQMIKNKTEDQEQIEHLIKETGFVRLSAIWKKAVNDIKNN